MSGHSFDVDLWLRRIGYTGSRAATLPTLRAVIAAHTATIPFENVDVVLGRPPKLDLGSLQRKMLAEARGGYCFEQNTLLQAGLMVLGFRVTGLLARVIRGMAVDAPRPQTHMTLRVDLAEGPFLVDVGFGAQTPTAPLAMFAGNAQETPHEPMRLWPAGDDLVLQASLGEDWQNIYRISLQPRLSVDYEVANWFAATHPASPFLNNLIVTRPGPGGTRNTLFNDQLSVRRKYHPAERSRLGDAVDFRTALDSTFGLVLSDDDLTDALHAMDRKGSRGTMHPFFS